ncbi:pimeloyl-ACP methyl ester carboxylesterase [Mucilaginibacter gracilis]|uniref:Pimeloyl-ACP methyl ester carboxylesterase n=1 Tax=Mucilaginibacter gracilis TaxID=423350 RepID=A0A495J6T1_9SPHI|nr:alpha/beta hydrolase [Mucilaginibacter gracilis]RKR84084.1 pimeloyl-ACP methyl ester carboxylesterase [Mucilaginibacter gracilis]
MENEKTNTTDPYSDTELIKQWPGFENRYTTVNGVELHYVEGGSGAPLICLPGWPQTWYSFKNVAPKLAEKYRVIVVDIRGMGTSAKPETGYDKKTMAVDIYHLISYLKLPKVHLLGHDIGGMVAMSIAFNFPDVVQKLIVMDGAHPSEGMMRMPLIPPLGTFTNKMHGDAPYAWWMSFNQVKGLPEKLLEGRFNYLLDWLFDFVMIDEKKISAFEKEVYAAAYNTADSIRASNGWYQTFTQDIEDGKTYQQLNMPVLGIASNVSYTYMKMGLPYVAKDCEVVGLLDSGHYMNEEAPEKVIDTVTDFLH